MRADVFKVKVKINSVLNQIELLRQQMMRTASLYGLSHPKVMIFSKKIDYLLIEYYQLLNDDKKDLCN